MTAYAILFTMAAIGIAETNYLIRKRRAKQRPVCPVGGGCSTVLESKYNALFGIHNDVLGLVFYLATAILTAFIVVGIGPQAVLNSIIAVLVAGALIMSAIFTYLQGVVIKSWCFWCVGSAITVLIMATTIAVSGFSYAI